MVLEGGLNGCSVPQRRMSGGRAPSTLVVAAAVAACCCYAFVADAATGTTSEALNERKAAGAAASEQRAEDAEEERQLAAAERHWAAYRAAREREKIAKDDLVKALSNPSATAESKQQAYHRTIADVDRLEKEAAEHRERAEDLHRRIRREREANERRRFEANTEEALGSGERGSLRGEETAEKGQGQREAAKDVATAPTAATAAAAVGDAATESKASDDVDRSVVADPESGQSRVGATGTGYDFDDGEF